MISHSACSSASESGGSIGDRPVDGGTTKLLVHGMRKDCNGKGLAVAIRQHLQRFCRVVHVSVRRNAALRVRGGFAVAIVRMGDGAQGALPLPDSMQKFAFQGVQLSVNLGCGDVRDALFPFLAFEQRTLMRVDDICRWPPPPHTHPSFSCVTFFSKGFCDQPADR